MMAYNTTERPGTLNLRGRREYCNSKVRTSERQISEQAEPRDYDPIRSDVWNLHRSSYKRIADLSHDQYHSTTRDDLDRTLRERAWMPPDRSHPLHVVRSFAATDTALARHMEALEPCRVLPTHPADHSQHTMKSTYREAYGKDGVMGTPGQPAAEPPVPLNKWLQFRRRKSWLYDTELTPSAFTDDVLTCPPGPKQEELERVEAAEKAAEAAYTTTDELELQVAALQNKLDATHYPDIPVEPPVAGDLVQPPAAGESADPAGTAESREPAVTDQPSRPAGGSEPAQSRTPDVAERQATDPCGAELGPTSALTPTPTLPDPTSVPTPTLHDPTSAPTPTLPDQIPVGRDLACPAAVPDGGPAGVAARPVTCPPPPADVDEASPLRAPDPAPEPDPIALRERVGVPPVPLPAWAVPAAVPSPCRRAPTPRAAPSPVTPHPAGAEPYRSTYTAGYADRDAGLRCAAAPRCPQDMYRSPGPLPRPGRCPAGRAWAVRGDREPTPGPAAAAACEETV